MTNRRISPIEYELLDSLDIDIAIMDREGNYVFVNTSVVKKRKTSRSDFLKMNVHDFMGVLDICVFDLVMESHTKVSRLQYYGNLHDSDERKKLRMVTGIPLFDENGQIELVISQMIDINDFNDTYNSLLRSTPINSFGSNIPQVDGNEKIIAQSQSFTELLEMAATVAQTNSSILLNGESGTGKEVLAKYIHEHSNRKDKKMIIVNCAAFPESIIESELFGYEKGAFTGASREGKVGLIEAANGGTLFLDEINSLPLSLQGKLLRALEYKEIQKLGSTKTKKVDFRLISATNKNLEELVENGTFREDLYYRINIFPLMIQPLRHRKEDIIPLLQHFLKTFSKQYNIEKQFAPSVLEQLKDYNWPGNVREVRNFAERMVIMTPRSSTYISVIPEGILQSMRLAGGNKETPATASIETVEAKRPEQPAESHFENEARTPIPAERNQAADFPMLPLVNRELTRENIILVLSHFNNNREAAAKYLGISKRTLQYKIKEFHLSSRCRYKENE